MQGTRVDVRHRATFRTRRGIAPVWAAAVLGGAAGALAGRLAAAGGGARPGATALAGALGILAVAAVAELDRPYPRFRNALRVALATLAVILVAIGFAFTGLAGLAPLFLIGGPFVPCYLHARETHRPFSQAAFGVIVFYLTVVLGMLALELLLGLPLRASPPPWAIGALVGTAATLGLVVAGRVDLDAARGLRLRAPRRAAAPRAGPRAAPPPAAPAAPEGA